MSKKKGKCRQTIGPDDYFEVPAIGLSVARFGRFIQFQTNRSPERQRELETHWLSMYPKVIAEIDAHVARARALVSQYDPLELLARGFWAMSASMIGKMSEHEYSFEDGMMARMVDYVQALVVATPPAQMQVQLSDEKWEELHREVTDVYQILATQFFIVNSAHLAATQADYDKEYDAFSVQAQMQATFVRALRYVAHDVVFLTDFLVPHDAVFQRQFGLSAVAFVEGIREIHDSLCRRSAGAFAELHEEHQRFIASLAGQDGAGEIGVEEAFAKLAADPASAERMRSIAGRIMGVDLFELEQFCCLPVPLLDHLSLAPGEDETFCGPGDYAGWPIRVFPTKWRPFLKVGDKHYCFDPINIMDDIYRAMQRLICRLEPGYTNAWKDLQQDATERRPMELLQELLPGATVYRSVHYPVTRDGAGRSEWCELDGLVLYDDLLIAVEVKGGAFTWTPPLTDLPAYLRSIETLLKKPADQASRFLRYLRSAATVQLYDQRHNPTISVAQAGFRVVVPLCVTLDALTMAAHQIDGLKGVGIAVPEPVCCLAIDDLRVYKDILPAGVVSAHFIEKRYAAERDPLVHVTDELDHLGLYLAYLDYARQARLETRRLGAEVRVWNGFREAIDRYFYLLLASPDEASKPQVTVGRRLQEILDCLNSDGRPGRCHCAAILLDLPKETKDDFDAAFDKSLARGIRRSIASPMHIQGESSVTVFCDAPQVRKFSPEEKQEYTLAWMLRANVPRRLLLTAVTNAAGKIVAVDWECLDLANVPAEKLGALRAVAASQAERRVSTHLSEHGKIGRNEPCPCGSGRKYKRCCGRLT